MRRLVCLLALTVLAAANAWAASATQRFHRDWTFHYFPASQPDLAVTAPAYDDATWPALALPHTWQTYETTRELHPFIHTAAERDDPYWWKGWGVYRKRFIVPAAIRAGDKLVFIEFDGVQKYSRVFLNGHELGDFKGGYFGFSFELTPHLHYDAENVLVVLVSNRRDDLFGGIPPMTAGNFNVYGGIYRDVRLVVKDRLFLPFQGSAAHEGGTFVTTPEVSRERAVVRVQTWIRNASATPRPVRLTTRLVDPAGAILQTLTRDFTLAAGVTDRSDQISAPVVRPQLWSPDRPALYSVVTLLESAGCELDRLTSPLGFRWFRWDTPTNRLVVNDEPLRINGTNRHQEFPWLGDAMPSWLQTRDLEDMRRNLGHNFMRTAHYPQDRAAYELTDRLGLITVAEVPNIKAIQFGRDIQETHARAMVRRLRNHPSIFFWSVGNETTQAADSRWIHEEDATRIIHARKASRFGDFVAHDHTNLDLESLLRCTVRGWHDADLSDLAALHPASGQHTGTEEWQHAQARVRDSSLRGIVNEPGVAWLYADHGADRIYPNAPLQAVNPKGWVDVYRVPKYMYYLWQANWLARPMVFVHPHHWRREFAGQRRDFQVDSNCEEVELFAAGDSQGTQRPSRANFQTVLFASVPVGPGTLRAEGRRAGRTVATWEVRLAAAPAKIVLSATHGDRFCADRAGLAEIRADITDADGVPVTGAHPPLSWEATGPGSLVGPALYTSDYDQRGADSGVWYITTPVSNLIRTTATPGSIRVRVTSPGLVPADVTLVAAPDDRTPTAGIVEPPLADVGRRPVTRVAGFVEEIPFHLDLTPMRDSPRFGLLPLADSRAALDRLIRERNPALKPTQPAYDCLLDRLAHQLVAASGTIVEDDFNFLAALYNTAAHLGRVIDTLGMHPAYLALWRAHLAAQLITGGRPLDVTETTALLRSIPAKGRLVDFKRSPGAPPATDYDRVTYRQILTAPDLTVGIALLAPTTSHAILNRWNPWLGSAPDHASFWLPDKTHP